MKSNSIDKENELEIKYFDPKIKNADGRKKNTRKEREKRGIWSDNRRLALLKAYRKYRPHAAEHGEKTNRWNQVTEAVNEKDPHLHPLKTASVIEQLPILLKRYKPTHPSGDIQRLAYTAWKMLQEDEEILEEKRSRKRPLRAKKQSEQNIQKPNAEGNNIDKNKRRREDGEEESGTNMGKVARRSEPNNDIDEDLKLLQDSINERRQQHQEILDAINTNTKAIQAMQETLIRLL